VRTATIAEDFRLALRNVAAAVAVVTTLDEFGEPHGTTVSAFMSLSMEPPLLAVSLDNRSRLLSHTTPGQRLGVNALADDQSDLARRFADPIADRWQGVDWDLEAGSPALNQRLAFLGIEVERLIPAGDHTLIVGAVRAASWTVGGPLTYWQRGFGTHSGWPEAAR
jgi:flavin reductase (DIM6/NTAB) family NADH-FMN oxidoreductase RutF